ncbi:hypothetical protein [Gottfriedia luciferensis]|uniref:hypothetical protein n=1 Tax=Gottfriedia luciferensis TaxID=178774 RepID=UPI000B450510|nr:hypothetical protein [Gottfriedia luciferensis]
MLKSTILQSIIFSLTIHVILVLSNFKLILGLFQSKPKDDFSFNDSYFIAYHSIFEDYPIIAMVLWITITFVLLALLYVIGKWICLKFIFTFFN